MDTPLWQPSAAVIARAQITAYQDWLRQRRGLEFADYAALWHWSVTELEAFWASLWEYFDIQAVKPYTRVLASPQMPGARWFEGAELNYVSQIFRHASEQRPAVIFQNEHSGLEQLSWAELERQVGALAHRLRELGIEPGDRVVAYLPNIPQALIGFLASASVGAVWSVCAPDLGVDGVLDRFAQIEPALLIAVDGYQYGGKRYPRERDVAALLDGLPTVRALILVSNLEAGSPQPFDGRLEAETWAEVTAGEHQLEPAALAFEHPLWILYSSGTTGKPKAIVHGHGGVLLEHIKLLSFHCDIGPEDRFMWYSSTAWMMWNVHIAGLLVGATICTYDGSPGWPDLDRLWRFVADSGATFFGAGAAFYDACRNADLEPRATVKLERLRAMGSTGSPLLPEAYQWLFEQVNEDLYLISTSGGTDFATGFIGAVPTLPTYAGEMSCLCLGAAVAAFDERGQAIIDEVGELVCTEPLPSMPLYFWNDADGAKYHASYFDMFPGIWRHGDWIKITARGSAIIYGRSDATINRQGIRMGTSELYRVVEALPEVADSLVVDLEYLGRDSYLPLFVVLQNGQQLDEALKQAISAAVRQGLSPRHVPNDVFQIDEVPRTFSGKKLEIPIRRLLLGHADAINRDTMANPDSVEYFVRFAEELAQQTDAKT